MKLFACPRFPPVSLDRSRLPPELTAHTETNGAWLATITNTPSRRITLGEDEWDVHQFLLFLSHSSGCHNTVFHPKLIARGAKVTVSFQDTLAIDALDQVLEKIGGVRTLQGGVMFMKPKQSGAHHQPGRLR